MRRAPFLIPLSKDHHQALAFAWNLSKGLEKNIEFQRLELYVSWFWDIHSKAHFEMEEMYIFPLLSDENELKIKALNDHSTLRTIFTDPQVERMTVLPELLTAHVRFEERILFNQIQDVASTEQKNFIISKIPGNSSCLIWNDEFWV